MKVNCQRVNLGCNCLDDAGLEKEKNSDILVLFISIAIYIRVL